MPLSLWHRHWLTGRLARTPGHSMIAIAIGSASASGTLPHWQAQADTGTVTASGTATGTGSAVPVTRSDSPRRACHSESLPVAVPATTITVPGGRTDTGSATQPVALNHWHWQRQCQ